MLNDQRPANTGDDDHHHQLADDADFRDIHALIPSPPSPPPPPPPLSIRGRRRESWETGSHRSLSVGSDVTLGEHFSTMSREFNAMVVAGSNMQGDGNGSLSDPTSLSRIGEEELEETNPLAIVPDNNPIASPRRAPPAGQAAAAAEEVLVHQVKKEEVESKISAWQVAEIAKINNRFKRDDVVINGWESDQVEKANRWLKKIERKLDEKRAKAVEKAQNDLARAHQKAEEKRASAEAKRGSKMARVLEMASFMRAVGRAPSKRSFF